MLEQIRFRTGDQTLVREINLSLILNRLRERGPISRAALAEITGLNKSTVSSLIRELISHNFVREVGLGTPRVGRRSHLLELNPQAGYIIGAEIGADYILVVCANFAAQIIWRHYESGSGQWSQVATTERLLAFLHLAQEACAGSGSLLGIAVGVAGLVDRQTGTLIFAPNLGWQNVPLGDLVRSSFKDAPVFVDNEANLSLLGEHFFGAAQGFDEVLYLSVGVGLGGGILRKGGQLFRGAAGFASEFGHMTMDANGEQCKCGNRGCWETQVSQSAVFRHIRHAVDSGQATVLCQMTDENLDRLTIAMAVKAAQSGDAVALGAFDQVGHHLGIGIASLVNALNPDMVVLGGVMSLAWGFLLPLINLELRQRALRWNADSTRVVLAQNGLDACVIGGVAMVVQAILMQPGIMIRSTA